ELELAEQQVAVSSAQKRKDELADDAAKAQEALKTAADALAKESARREQAAPELEAATQQAVEKVLAGVWEEQRISALGSDAGALLTALADARRELQRGRALLGPH